MRIKVEGPLRENPRVAMRMASYAENVSRRTGDVSYVRRLGGGEYPRFHVYVDQEGEGLRIKIHLDQKQASYQGHTAHSGEYEDSGVVEQEAARLRAFFARLKA